jgi:uncharacterized protein (TIGR02147 family)
MKKARIFDFYDFRSFLKNELEFRKTLNPQYSFRSFALSMGINPSTLLRVMSRERNISSKTLPLFVKQLKLNQRESEYFELLVLFDQTPDPKPKLLIQEQINQFRKSRLTKAQPSQYEFYDKWYHTVIREYIALSPCTRNSYKDIAKKLSPVVTAPLVKASLTLLERLKLIEINSLGFYFQTSQTLTTGDDWTGTTIHSFQKQMSALGEASLDNFRKSERDISTVTMSLSETGFERMKAKLNAVRKELIQMALEDEGQNKVYQLNYQLFPLTQPIENEAK